MKTKRPNTIRTTSGMHNDSFVKLNFIGGDRPYIRLESQDGTYLGCIPDRLTEKLMVWCKEAHKGWNKYK